jgi:hypothetical protein
MSYNGRHYDDEQETEKQTRQGQPLLSNTVNGKVIGGVIVGAIVGVLGFIGTNVLEVTRELERIANESEALRTIVSQRLSRHEDELDELDGRVDVLQQEMARREVLIRQVEYLQERSHSLGRGERNHGP